jgi:hypothetical protein
MPSVRLSRTWHAVVAVLVLVALVVQVWIAWKAAATPPGHAVGTLAGTSFGGRLLRVLSFFTIQSNILSAVVGLQLARDPLRDGSRWRAVRLSTLLGITITGIVYGTVLARVHEPHGWQQVSTNTVFHYISPIMMVLGWLLFGPRPRIDGRTILLSLIWPVAWLVYTLIRGSATKWYPYPFLDVTTHGYLTVAVNSVLVVLLFLAVSTLFWWGDRRVPGGRE